MKPSILVLSILSALFAAVGAQAQVTSVVEWRLTSAAGAVLSRHTTQSACDTAARALAVTATYSCPRFLAVTGPVAPPPPPPPTCTTPQPAPQTQTVACPVGTTGSWTQTNAYVAAPAPTCWVPSAWLPATAPAGACVTPPPPPPPATSAYPLYPALDMASIPWHVAAGPWGAQVPLQAPALPVTTRQVSVSSASAFTQAAAVAGTQITVTAGWAGNSIVTINASDVDVILPAGVAVGAIEMGGWPRTTPIARVRIRGEGRMGQLRATPGTAGIYTDVVLDGVSMNGDSAFGGAETNQAFRVDVTRFAVLNVRAIAAGYVWLGGAKHVVIANSNFYHGAATRAATGFAEGWGIRNTGGPITIVDSRIQGTRYHNIRAQAVNSTDETLLYITRSTIVGAAEGRTAWLWNNLNNGPWFGRGAILERNDIYTYSAAGCVFGAEISSANVTWSRIANNRFFGGGGAVFSGVNANGGGTEGNVFAALSSLPAWAGPGDPTQVPLPNGMAVIAGEWACPGF